VGLLWAAEPATGTESPAMPQRRIEEVLSDHTNRLLAVPGVVGTARGLCDGRPCIKVYVVKKTPELLAQLPVALDGYTVAVEESGEFRAF
jgi:hypothetical protein